MQFEWDDNKEIINQLKHGVSFQEASEVFGDDYSSFIYDPDHSIEEERYLLFGLSSQGKYLVVSFTERSNIIRIISVRIMTKQERNGYEQR